MHPWTKAYHDTYTEDQKRELYELEAQLAASCEVWRVKCRLAEAMMQPIRERMNYNSMGKMLLIE